MRSRCINKPGAKEARYKREEQMTIKEAEELFKELNGEDPYLIWHEAGEKALHEYYELEIPYNVKCDWTAELMEKHFASMEANPERAWHEVACILDLLETNYCDANWYGSRLLDALEHTDSFDAENRVLITEYMGSRLRNKDSGCKIFCLKTDLGERLNRIMQRLTDFSCPPETADERYPKRVSLRERREKAIAKYRDEYEKWRR